MRDKRQRSWLWLWLAIAAVLHGAVLPAVQRAFHAANGTQVANKPVRVISLESTRGGDYRLPPGYQRPPRASKPAEVAKKIEKKPEPLPRGQVVDIPPSPDGRAPDKADYLAEHNSHAERQTRSRHQRADYSNVQHERSEERQGERQQEGSARPRALAVGEQKPGTTQLNQARAPALEFPNIKARDRLALRLDPDLGQYRNQTRSDALRGNSERADMSPGEPDAGQGAPPATAPALSMDDLVPSIGKLTTLSGGPSNDMLEHVEEGEGTFLNAREFKYASFFNRLKHGVSQHWNAQSEFQRRDPTGNIYGLRARLTVVNVTLNGDGSLQDVAVKQSCGVDFLDDEALTAFRRAQPFPNPPRGLLDPNGQVTFAFGFQIMIVGR